MHISGGRLDGRASAIGFHIDIRRVNLDVWPIVGVWSGRRVGDARNLKTAPKTARITKKAMTFMVQLPWEQR